MTSIEVLRVEIPHALAGERVDKAVALLADLPRSVVARLVDEGAVRADGRPVAKVSARLHEGSLLEVDLPPPSDDTIVADPNVAFRVEYEDEHIAVINKPAGLVVHPGHGVRSATLVHGLLATFPDLAAAADRGEMGPSERPGIVHRLDAGTSGLLVVARTPEAHRLLTAMLAAHDVERSYVALVHGVVTSSGGLIDAPLGRDPKVAVRRAVVPDGKHARTRYEVEERLVGRTVLGCTLETGRTHQIRVHLAAIGHPVVGDILYGGRAELDLARPFLHARALRFVHPVTGAAIDLSAALPADLVVALVAAQAEGAVSEPPAAPPGPSQRSDLRPQEPEVPSHERPCPPA